MVRTALVSIALTTACLGGRAEGHDREASDRPACDVMAGEICYSAELDNSHTPLSPHHDASGEAFFTLNSARSELRYSLTIHGLKLKPIAASRTEPDDVAGIHLHLNVPGTIGPHILNIFGWPAEEDADAVFDYEHQSIFGIYDVSDASINPATGEPYLQNLPLTSKIIYDWLDQLDEGKLMLAVHTVATGFSVMAIHGHIHQVVPEPGTVGLLLSALTWFILRRRKP
jgi:hypothetical protein